MAASVLIKPWLVSKYVRNSSPSSKSVVVGSDDTYLTNADLALHPFPMKDWEQPSHGLTACIDNHGIKKATTHFTSGDSGSEFGPI